MASLLLLVGQGCFLVYGPGFTALHSLPKGGGQFRHIQRFLHIADCFQLDCGLQVLFVRVSAHENDDGARTLFQQLLRHVHPVHSGHAHIGQHNIRFPVKSRVQSMNSVVLQKDWEMPRFSKSRLSRIPSLVSFSSSTIRSFMDL